MTTRTLEEMKVRRLFCDGGMRDLLQARGLEPGEFPEWWNLTHRNILTSIHRFYLEAGVDIMTANTFGVSKLKSKEDLKPIVTATVENARTMAKGTGYGYIALDLGPTRRLLKPLDDLESEGVVKLYKEVVSIGAKAGVDLALTETMNDSYELKVAVLAARGAGFRSNTGERLPVFAIVILDEKGKLLTGRNAEPTVALLEGLRMDALGVNCGLGSVQMKGILEEILRISPLPVLVNPNAGLPRNENGRTVYSIDAEDFALVMEEIVTMGVMVVGRCCDTTPEHIHLMMRRCKDMPVVWPEKKYRTVVSSYAKVVIVGGKIIIIGERINSIGKSKFKQVPRDCSLGYILKEGVSQQDSGADVLDMNMELPGIHEPSIMGEAVGELQAIIDLPLQIDTSNMEAMERAMRIYNGKPLISFVNGKEESMTRVFPLMTKYGGVAVGFCLDEPGTPDTVEGRLVVGRRTIDRTTEYRIGPEDIILDGLCMTVNSGSKGALITLGTLWRVRDELEVGTILGVSNISFGLPQGEIISVAFFTMAMECGLGAAIINPNSEVMMCAYYSFNALMDLDPQCGQYISIYSGQSVGLGQTVGRGGSQDGTKADHQSRSGETGASQEPTLSAAIERGLGEAAYNAVSALLKEREPLDITNSEMISALDCMGEGFEKGTTFPPQLPTSAEVTKVVFEVIKAAVNGGGQIQEKRETVIPATVKGDTYDIGKNIMKVLLENYNYEVIDLGRDVPPKVIVKEAVERQVALVGLSALVTTTVPSIEEIICQLRAAPATVKMTVGGVMLTEDYTRTIGVDACCRGAMASINYAEQIFGAWNTGKLLCFHGFIRESPSTRGTICPSCLKKDSGQH